MSHSDKEQLNLLHLLMHHAGEPTPTLQKVLAWADLDDEACQDPEMAEDFNIDKREAMEYTWDKAFLAGLRAGVALALNHPISAAETLKTFEPSQDGTNISARTSQPTLVSYETLSRTKHDSIVIGDN